MDPKVTIGSSTHITIGSTPSSPMVTAPMENPMTVPVIARSPVVPVDSALLRNTDSAPSTTHKPFWIGKTRVTTTAKASARPLRRLLNTVIDPVLR